MFEYFTLHFHVGRDPFQLVKLMREARVKKKLPQLVVSLVKTTNGFLHSFTQVLVYKIYKKISNDQMCFQLFLCRPFIGGIKVVKIHR